MKKIFSILALLLLLVAFYPSKVEAQVKPGDKVTGNEASDGFCVAGGCTCAYIELEPVVL